MARVLLVHDDLAEAARLRRALRDAGHEPLLAAGAGDAPALAAWCDAVVVGAACEGGEALAWARAAAVRGVAIGAGAEQAAPLAAIPAPAEPAALAEALAGQLARPAPPPPAAVPPAPPPPPPPARPGLARGAEAALRALFGARAPRVPAAEAAARLDALAAAARTADYFEVLGVPRGCTAEEARLAADALLAALDRDLAGAAGAGDERLADVRQVVLDARDVLGDDARRDAYRRALGG